MKRAGEASAHGGTATLVNPLKAARAGERGKKLSSRLLLMEQYHIAPKSVSRSTAVLHRAVADNLSFLRSDERRLGVVTCFATGLDHPIQWGLYQNIKRFVS